MSWSCGLDCFPSLTTLKILFLQVSLSLWLHQLVSGTDSVTIITCLVPVFNSLRDGRAKARAGFLFNVKKQSMLESGGAFLVKKPHLDTKPDSHQGGWKSAGDASASSTDSRQEGEPWGTSFLIQYTVFDFINIIFISYTGWYTSTYLDQRGALHQ